MSKNLLIVGVDPGTTLGYAILDIDGNLVSIKSSRLLDLNSLISEIIQNGIPILIGTDRKDIPRFIERLGAKIGARIITPDKDMPVDYKKVLARDFEKGYRNEHERDALASAIYALKQTKSLITKVDNFVEKNKKQGLREDLIHLILKNEIPLSIALEITESPEREENRIIKKAIDEKKFDKDFLKLYEKLKGRRRENEILKAYNEKLKGQIKATEQKMGYIKRKIDQLEPDEKAQEQLHFKEERIHAMSREIELKNEKIEYLTSEINKLNKIILDAGGNILVKKLKNLGTKEFESKKALLNIKRGDILFVEDLNIYSENIIDWIKNRVDVIIFNNKINTKIDNKFILISSKNLDIREDKNFAVINKDQFEKAKSKTGILDRIIKDYRKERKA